MHQWVTKKIIGTEMPGTKTMAALLTRLKQEERERLKEDGTENTESSSIELSKPMLGKGL